MHDATPLGKQALGNDTKSDTCFESESHSGCGVFGTLSVSPLGGRMMLDELLDAKVVVDLMSPYVCLGRLTRYDDHFIELKNADLHDLRDTETTRNSTSRTRSPPASSATANRS